MTFVDELVRDFANGISSVDATHPVAVNQRSGTAFQPGIGPHTEANTVKLVMAHLAERAPTIYGHYALSVSYADGSRQSCDLCFGGEGRWDWAVEVKMLRLMGD